MNQRGRGEAPDDVIAEEARLVAACRRGNCEAFRPLVIRYERRVFAIALRMLGSRAEAQDAAQDAFLRAYVALARFDTTRRFSTWLYRIVINACIDRKRRDRELPHAEPPGSSESPATSLELAETRAAVAAALMQLSPAYRAVLVLKDVEDLDYQSVREILGGSIGSLKIKVLRARAKLAAVLRDLYPGRFEGV